MLCCLWNLIIEICICNYSINIALHRDVYFGKPKLTAVDVDRKTNALMIAEIIDL